MTEKLLTIEEVADRLNLAPRTIYRYIKDGKLTARKIGKRWQVKEEDLAVFIDGIQPNK